MSNIQCEICEGDYKVCEHGFQERLEKLEVQVAELLLVPEHYHEVDGEIARVSEDELDKAKDRALEIFRIFFENKKEG